MLDVLGLDPDTVPKTFPYYGNIGPAAVPITLAAVADDLAPGDSVVCMGIGSGLNAGVLELQW
jgi:3-oxoacyl-[acyl-carrier-protein] synthase-3